MQKRAMGILVLVTCIFAAFTLGFFAGRHLNRAPVRIYQIASPTDASGSDPTVTDPVQPLMVNINTATALELEALPGIGATLAQRIVDYRRENGPFESPEALINVKGIGENKMKDLLDLITIGG